MATKALSSALIGIPGRSQSSQAHVSRAAFFSLLMLGFPAGQAAEARKPSLNTSHGGLALIAASHLDDLDIGEAEALDARHLAQVARLGDGLRQALLELLVIGICGALQR